MGMYEQAKAFLEERARAFRLTFAPLYAALKWTKRGAFREVFGLKQPAHFIVLNDLAIFCRANESCVVPGDRDKTAMLEGRREVWLRIQQHLQLSPDQLFAITSGRAPQTKDTSK